MTPPIAIFERSYPDNYVVWVAENNEEVKRRNDENCPHRYVSKEIATKIKGRIEYGQRVTNSDVEQMEREETKQALDLLA